MFLQRFRIPSLASILPNVARGLGRGIGKAYLDCRGQSTVEYAVALFGFLALVLALGAIWNFLQDGALVKHALQSASHHVTLVNPGALRDVFLY